MVGGTYLADDKNDNDSADPPDAACVDDDAADADHADADADADADSESSSGSGR